MSTFLIVNRQPHDYYASQVAMQAWNAWFDSLGRHLVDRGNPTFDPHSLGAPAGETRLGGYTLIAAADLTEALELASTCPMIADAGGLEIGELTVLNDGSRQAADGRRPHVPGYEVRSELYVNAGPQSVWEALTLPEQTERWWAHHNISTWRSGASWAHQRIDGSGIADVAGTVLEVVPAERLVLTWANPEDGSAVSGVEASAGTRSEPSRVRLELEPYRDIVRIRVTHDRLASQSEQDALAAGWAAVLSNLKTYLECGQPLRQPPWDMLTDFVRG